MQDDLAQQSIELLKKLISIPSFSKEEDLTAAAIQDHLQQYQVKTYRKLNNVWAFNKFYDALIHDRFFIWLLHRMLLCKFPGDRIYRSLRNAR